MTAEGGFSGKDWEDAKDAVSAFGVFCRRYADCVTAEDLEDIRKELPGRLSGLRESVSRISSETGFAREYGNSMIRLMNRLDDICARSAATGSVDREWKLKLSSMVDGYVDCIVGSESASAIPAPEPLAERYIFL